MIITQLVIDSLKSGKLTAEHVEQYNTGCKIHAKALQDLADKEYFIVNAVNLYFKIKI